MARASPPKRWSKGTSTAFEIIETIDELNGATVTELAEQMDLAASSVHNHLGALFRRGYVLNEDGEYHLGLRFLSLGMSVRNDHELGQIAQPVVENMAERSGESAWAVTMEFDRVVFLNAAKGSEGVETFGTIGSRRLPHAHASGKAIMAYQSEEEVQAILDRTGLPAFTENTITSRGELFDEFEKIKRRGFAINRSEQSDPGRAIAAAVLKEESPIGAVGMSGPAQRFQDERLMGELSDIVIEGKDVLELKLSAPN